MILAILQARVSSTRLPGKVLKPILGRPMLSLQIERIQRSNRIQELVLATSDKESDTALEDLGKECNVEVFRGSEGDVLDRFYRAALPHSPSHVVRLTGDCPLTDPEIIDKVIALHVDGAYDYTSNVIPPTFPDGLDVEVFRMSALEEAWKEARLVSEREHVTPFICEQPSRYRQGLLRNDIDLSDYRWTVDEPTDFVLIANIIEALYPRNPAFGMRDVLRLLEERPEWALLNSRFRRNEGYEKLLSGDRAIP
jgi:spore coat polysaccharide biosynthesis protein SpsF